MMGEEKEMKTPAEGNTRRAAGVRALLLLAVFAVAAEGAPSASSWASGGLSPQDFLLRHNYPDPRFAPLEPGLPPHGGILVRTRGCLECHRLSEQGARGGVDLSGVGRRLNAEAIERILLDPQGFNPQATMLRPPLTRAEVIAITEFLTWLR